SPGTLWSATRLRQRVGALSTLGTTETLVVRDGGQTATAFGGDFDLRNASHWSASGWVAGTANGICHRGCDPIGATLSAGRRGGEARAWVDASYTGAEFDPNDMGYLAHLVGDQTITETTHVEFFRPGALGALSRMYADLSLALAWDPNAGTGGLFDN